MDQRLFLTHVRGELEPEDRGSGAAHDGPIHAMLLGPEDKFYTAGQDGTLRTWLRGAHKKRPSTLKDVGRAVEAPVGTGLASRSAQSRFILKETAQDRG